MVCEYYRIAVACTEGAAWAHRSFFGESCSGGILPGGSWPHVVTVRDETVRGIIRGLTVLEQNLIKKKTFKECANDGRYDEIFLVQYSV